MKFNFVKLILILLPEIAITIKCDSKKPLHGCPMFKLAPCPSGYERKYEIREDGCQYPLGCELVESSSDDTTTTTTEDIIPTQKNCPMFRLIPCPSGYERKYEIRKDGCQYPLDCELVESSSDDTTTTTTENIIPTQKNCPMFKLIPCPSGYERKYEIREDGCQYPLDCELIESSSDDTTEDIIPTQKNCPMFKLIPCPSGYERKYEIREDGCQYPLDCELIESSSDDTTTTTTEGIIPTQKNCPMFRLIPCPSGYERKYEIRKDGCQYPLDCELVESSSDDTTTTTTEGIIPTQKNCPMFRLIPCPSGYERKYEIREDGCQYPLDCELIESSSDDTTTTTTEGIIPTQKNCPMFRLIPCPSGYERKYEIRKDGCQYPLDCELVESSSDDTTTTTTENIIPTQKNCPMFKLIPCPSGYERKYEIREDGCQYPLDCELVESSSDDTTEDIIPTQKNCPMFKLIPCPSGYERKYEIREDGCQYPLDCELIESSSDDTTEDIIPTQKNCPMFKLIPCPSGYERKYEIREDGCQYPLDCELVESSSDDTTEDIIPTQKNCPMFKLIPCPSGYERKYEIREDGCQYPLDCELIESSSDDTTTTTTEGIIPTQKNCPMFKLIPCPSGYERKYEIREDGCQYPLDCELIESSSDDTTTTTTEGIIPTQKNCPMFKLIPCPSGYERKYEIREDGCQYPLDCELIESSSDDTTTTSTVSKATKVPQINCASKWGQCGGKGYHGPNCCKSNLTCHKVNKWYSKCI
ncbi:hypothetical protein U3516DRAFT_234514 [Neocallimastix sp. 'constans']